VNLIDYLAGAGTLLVGIVIGHIRRPRRRSMKPVKAICRSCKHGVGYHTERTGRCNKPVRVMRDPCNCQSYDGPQPLPDYYAPEIGV